MSGQLLNVNRSLDLVTLFLPVTGKSLLVPNVALAEVVPITAVEIIDDMPNWLIGTLQWRKKKIPLISFEAINDEPFVEAGDYLRVAVMNGCQYGEKMPFYAIALRGTPRMTRVVEEEVIGQDTTDLGIAESMSVVVEGVEAIIPNLEYIEAQVHQIFDELNITD
ncbi:MAG: chemosensory pili system protein ChpC [Flavobacteriales bacterium]|jgi:chemosensory pili system protein ChpC